VIALPISVRGHPDEGHDQASERVAEWTWHPRDGTQKPRARSNRGMAASAAEAREAKVMVSRKLLIAEG